jgi:hypothetical protein
MNLVTELKFFAKSLTNFHLRGKRSDIFLFATPRGGSTWVMELLASESGIKFFDEPLSPRRENVARGGFIRGYESLMPETGDAERIIEFLRDLQQGKHGYMNVAPFQRNHRFLTTRCVFKVHEIEHLMHRVEAECAAQIVYLIRHPIATSISRNALPRLELFLDSPFYGRLIGNDETLTRIRGIARTGTTLQKAIISWCYENLVPLRDLSSTWLTITYEELVLNPEQSCDLLVSRLDLTDRDAIISSFARPAVNILMSHAETLAALNDGDSLQRRRTLVTKWQAKVDDSQIERAAEILRLFEIDA